MKHRILSLILCAAAVCLGATQPATAAAVEPPYGWLPWDAQVRDFGHDWSPTFVDAAGLPLAPVTADGQLWLTATACLEPGSGYVDADVYAAPLDPAGAAVGVELTPYSIPVEHDIMLIEQPPTGPITLRWTSGCLGAPGMADLADAPDSVPIDTAADYTSAQFDRIAAAATAHVPIDTTETETTTTIGDYNAPGNSTPTTTVSRIETPDEVATQTGNTRPQAPDLLTELGLAVIIAAGFITLSVATGRGRFAPGEVLVAGALGWLAISETIGGITAWIICGAAIGLPIYRGSRSLLPVSRGDLEDRDTINPAAITVAYAGLCASAFFGTAAVLDRASEGWYADNIGWLALPWIAFLTGTGLWLTRLCSYSLSGQGLRAGDGHDPSRLGGTLADWGSSYWAAWGNETAVIRTLGTHAIAYPIFAWTAATSQTWAPFAAVTAAVLPLTIGAVATLYQHTGDGGLDEDVAHTQAVISHAVARFCPVPDPTQVAANVVVSNGRKVRPAPAEWVAEQIEWTIGGDSEGVTAAVYRFQDPIGDSTKMCEQIEAALVTALDDRWVAKGDPWHVRLYLPDGQEAADLAAARDSGGLLASAPRPSDPGVPGGWPAAADTSPADPQPIVHAPAGISYEDLEKYK